jgi:phenylalanyl-tRNA synthetase beta chain
MKVSTNLLRYYDEQYKWGSPVPTDITEFVERIGAQLGGVEEVTALGPRFEGIPVIKIISCINHPNSDHLHICKVDDGGVIKDVPRDAEGLVQVVTGAPNVRDGFVCAWLPPGSTVPESHDKEPFVLEARPLRGEVSYGMLASARELTLGDDHNGIMELDADIKPGTWIADACDFRDDYIIDIENKMFTHRPDCFGLIGIAREIAGIYQHAFKSPDWYKTNAQTPVPTGELLPVVVINEVPELVPRFTALPIRDITIKLSPLWLRMVLIRLGIRPINNIVDLTNYYMLLTGQPLHAYDYDKVRAQDPDSDTASLVVRHPEKGEKLKLLSGKTVEPSESALFIATKTKPIGLAGVMGGGDTEVDDTTKNIILEAATFDMYTIRRMSMASGVFTDAVTRFNKGQSPLQNPAVIAKITEDILQLAGGAIAGPLLDDNHLSKEVMDRGNLYAPVTVTRSFIADRLGITISANEMAQLLRNVEFNVQVSGDTLTTTAPFWRTDIAIAEDIVEEIGRLYGYDKLPLTLPKRDLAPAARNAAYDLKTRLANYLRCAGANEVLTYTFVHGKLLQVVGQDPTLAFQLSNALSPDLQYYRVSLTPSLLDKVHANVKTGYESFALFELNESHIKTNIDENGLPIESQRLAFVFAADGKAAKQFEGASYYQAKVYLSGLLQSFNLEEQVAYLSLSEAVFEGQQSIEQLCRPFEPARSAVVLKDSHIVGVVGEYRGSVQKTLKLPTLCAGFELLTDSLEVLSANTYVPLPRFPKVEQDMCLRIGSEMSFQQLYDFVREQIAMSQPENVYVVISPVDIYQREGDKAHKQITVRLSIASYERTLTDAEVAKLLDVVASAAHAKFNAERV